MRRYPISLGRVCDIALFSFRPLKMQPLAPKCIKKYFSFKLSHQWSYITYVWQTCISSTISKFDSHSICARSSTTCLDKIFYIQVFVTSAQCSKFKYLGSIVADQTPDRKILANLSIVVRFPKYGCVCRVYYCLPGRAWVSKMSFNLSHSRKRKLPWTCSTTAARSPELCPRRRKLTTLKNRRKLVFCKNQTVFGAKHKYFFYRAEF